MRSVYGKSPPAAVNTLKLPADGETSKNYGEMMLLSFAAAKISELRHE